MSITSLVNTFWYTITTCNGSMPETYSRAPGLVVDVVHPSMGAGYESHVSCSVEPEAR
jgi:hypothetical protein